MENDTPLCINWDPLELHPPIQNKIPTTTPLPDNAEFYQDNWENTQQGWKVDIYI